MEVAKRLLKILLIGPVVAVIHFIILLDVFFLAFYLTSSTVPLWHAIGEVFKFITVNILLFPMTMRDEWFSFIDPVDYYLPFNSLVWGVAAYVVILIYHLIKRLSGKSYY